MLKSIQKLCDKLNKVTKQLTEVRAKCPHKKYRIGLWMDAPGRINNAKICERCGDNIGLVFDDNLPDPTKILSRGNPDNIPYFDRMGM